MIAAGGASPAVRAQAPEIPTAVVPAVDTFVPDPAGPYLAPDGAWPARWGDGKERGHAVVVPLDAPATRLLVRRLRAAPGTPSAEDRADMAALAASSPAAPGPTLTLEGPNSIVFERSSGPRPRGVGTGPGPEAGPEASLVFKVVSGTARPGDRRPAIVEVQRTWFAWYDAIDADGAGSADADARAALVMPGLFGNPEPTIDGLVHRLRKEGFGVLRMLAQPSRFTERVEFRIDGADLEGSAARTADVLGDRAAECAYSSERAWAYVEENRPGVRTAPRVIIGMSGGAISLPVVFARGPERYGAAVIIAGGADYWLINERSNYRWHIGAIETEWPTGVTPAQRAEFDRLYLAHAPLDSFHTAGALKGRPVLVLEGLADHAVPTALGDVLWERLGRPERWTYPIGHELLFAGLPGEFDRLMGWLNRAAPLPRP